MGIPRSVFISYAREDSSHARALYRHLAEFERQHGGKVFFDQVRIDAGYRWDTQIQQALNGAQLVLLLISSHFIRSEFCIDKESKQALQRQRKKPKDVLVMPVLVSACHFHNTAPDPEGPALGKLQAAGPFKAQDGRLVAMDQVEDVEAAWSDIVHRIYKHFGLTADAKTNLALRSEPAADLDLPELLAWCNRTELLAAIDDHLDLPASPQAALLTVAGDAANRVELLMDRMGVELADPPRSRQVKVAHIRKDYGFDTPARVGKAALEPLGLRSAADVAPWMEQEKLDLLLLCHYADCSDWPEARLATWLSHAAVWLHEAALPPQRRLLLLSNLRYTNAAPSWMDRLLRRGGEVLPRIRQAHADALTAEPLASHSAGPLVTLGDYPKEEFRQWLALDRVRSGLGRVARDLDEPTLQDWFGGGHCGHAELLTRLRQRHTGQAAK